MPRLPPIPCLPLRYRPPDRRAPDGPNRPLNRRSGSSPGRSGGASPRHTASARPSTMCWTRSTRTSARGDRRCGCTIGGRASSCCWRHRTTPTRPLVIASRSAMPISRRHAGCDWTARKSCLGSRSRRSSRRSAAGAARSGRSSSRASRRPGSATSSGSTSPAILDVSSRLASRTSSSSRTCCASAVFSRTRSTRSSIWWS